MKTRKLQNKLKLALLAVCMLSIGAVNAQRTDASTNAATDFTKQANTVLGEDGGSVKVIDNKGTIKYLQASNGVTMFTDTAPNGGVITTWQLGGTLTDDTNITTGAQEFKITITPETAVGAGDAGTFVIDGLSYIADTDVAAADKTATTGYTLLVRDEATGETKKMLASDLLSGIRTEYTQSANATGDVAITVSGLPVLTAGTTLAKLFVYRNGAKLRAGTDFVATAGFVTITYSATDLPMYAGDVIEVQFIK